MSDALLTDGARAALISTLDAYHGTDSSAALKGKGEPTDALLVFRRLLECGRYRSEQDLKLAVAQYTEGRPLAYITETHPFGDLTLTIRPPVYIPRVETEQWVLLLGQRISDTLSHHSAYSSARPFRILDICSGSGCIPLLLASLGKGLVHVVGLEVDDRALAVARENIERNGLGEVARFEKFDLFDDRPEAMEDLRRRIGSKSRGQRTDAIDGDSADGQPGFGFDMVVSNPPYVSSEDMRKVEKTWYEGRFALQGKLPTEPLPPATHASSGAGDAAPLESSVRNGTTTETHPRGVGGENGDVQDGDDGYSFYRRIKALYSIFLDEADTNPRIGQQQSGQPSHGDGDSVDANNSPDGKSDNSDNTLPKLVLEVGAKQSRPVQEMYASEGRLEVTKETERRREVGAPQLEQGDMVGTERSVWVYRW